MNGGLSKSKKNGHIGLWWKPLPPCGFNSSKCLFVFFITSLRSVQSIVGNVHCTFGNVESTVGMYIV